MFRVRISIPPETIVDYLELAWDRCMDEGRSLIPEIERVLDSFYLSGDLPMEFVDTWKKKIQYCPRGYDYHIDTRSWCAYCGDILSDNCRDCHTWYDSESSCRDYEQIKLTERCLRCERENEIDSLRWELKALTRELEAESSWQDGFTGWDKERVQWKIHAIERRLYSLESGYEDDLP
jgi:hypothetical protein